MKCRVCSQCRIIEESIGLIFFNVEILTDIWKRCVKGNISLRVFENRVLRRIFGPRREENCVMRSFLTCTVHKYNKNDKLKEDEMGRACSMNVEKRISYTLLAESQKE
jgi:hypothetical protein